MEQTPKPASMWQGTSPQIAFIFGMIGGVAVTAIAGFFFFMPSFAKSSKSASNGTTTTTTPPPTDTGTQTYGDVRAVGDNEAVRGKQDAKLTLVEYSDYECPFCKSFHPTMLQVMEEYQDDVRWVYRHFPLSFHQNAQKQAEAALCVNKLGGSEKFWDFSDTLFERTASNGTGFALDKLPALAAEIGVNESKFKDCLDGGEMAELVTADTSDGSNAGASGTPTTFIVGPDGKTIDTIPGAEPFAQVKTRLDAALASL